MRILINNQIPIRKDIMGKILKRPLESFSDSLSSFPTPGKDLNITPSKHIK